MKKINPSTLLITFGLCSNVAMTQFVEQTHSLTSGTQNLQCLDGKTCYASSSIGLTKVIKTSDGENWQNASGDLPVNGSFSSLFCFTNEHCIIMDNTALIYETTDGGNSWRFLSQGGNYMNFFNASIGAMYDSGIKLSENMGADWYAINPPNSLVVIPFFLTSEFGYVISGTEVTGLPHQIHRTTNGGNTWELVSEDTISLFDYGLTTMHIVNENVAYAAGTKGIILKTTDGGNNWAPIMDHPYKGTVFFKAMDFIDERYGYVVGGGSVILKTTNGGETWIDESFTFNLGFEAVQVADLNNIYVFGTGYLLKNDSANVVGLEGMQQETSLGKIYPNPVTTQLTLEFNEFTTEMAFSLYDVSGKLVKQFDLKSQKTVLPRGDIENGLYFYRITDKNKSLISTGKLNFK